MTPEIAVPFTLEQGKRLSDSAIWELGRGYFDDQGQQAWTTKTVPCDITSSPFIASCAARLVLSYLRDCVQGRHLGSPCAIDPEKPVYIVELASGSGRYSYLFLKKLLQLKDASSLKSLQVRFVMTDFTLKNIHAWMDQPWLKPFLERGVLDFARFDMEQSDRLELLRSGAVLHQGSLENPLVVLANYAMCVVRHDLFRTSGGELQEGLLTVTSRKAASFEEVELRRINELNLDFRYQKIDKLSGYYENPDFERILSHYQANLPDQSFLFPTGAIRCMERMVNLAGGRLMMLLADIAAVLESELKIQPRAKPLRFYGSPVADVNFHALQQYCRNLGGQTAATSQRGLSLKLAAFFFGGGERGQELFADTLLEFQETVESFGPSNLENLSSAFSQRDLVLGQLLELLRLTQWDPMVYLACGQALPGQVFFAKQSILEEFRHGLEKLWENFHPLSGDLPFELGRAYLALGLTDEAIRFCELSIQMFGDHPATRFNLGLCHYRREDLSAALDAFAKAIEQRPDFPRAELFRARALIGETLPPATFLASSEKI